MEHFFHINSVPSLKPTVQRNDLYNKIFLRTSARVTEIEQGNVYSAIINAADGIRTLEAIVVLLREDGYDEATVLRALRELDELLLLEDRAVAQSGLTEAERQRWARNLNFFGSFTPFGGDASLAQKRIRDAKVTLLGLGGLGSHILYDLAALGCKDVLAVEFDKVEISNLNRQILYSPCDIGKQKSDVAREKMRAFSPDLAFRVYETMISGVEDVAAAIAGRDIVICVADRPKTEILHWVNAACVEEGIPLITGGLDTQVARYYSILPGEGCLECWRSQVRESQPDADALLNEQRRTQLRGDNAAFVPFVALIAGFIVAEFSKIITGVGGPPVAHNRTREMHFSTLDVVTGESWSRRDQCGCCGSRMTNGSTIRKIQGQAEPGFISGFG